MGYINSRKVGGDFFSISKLNNKGKDLETYTSCFNSDDYYIYKATGRFKEVSNQDFLIFKYARYIFFNKRLYDKNWLDLWIDWANKNTNLLFIDKPPPRFNPEKIKIY
jgi:hypothetical protein